MVRNFLNGQAYAGNASGSGPHDYTGNLYYTRSGMDWFGGTPLFKPKSPVFTHCV